MALIVDLTETPYGIAITGAYARISLLRADKQGLLLQVSRYATESAAKAGAQPILDRTEFAPTAALQNIQTGTLPYKKPRRRPGATGTILSVSQ